MANDGGNAGGNGNGGGRGGKTPIERLAPFAVEVGDDTNRQFMLTTIRMTLRGSWSVASLHSRDNGRAGRDLGGAMSRMPAIPGMNVIVEPDKHRIRIFDPLSLPANKDLLERINRIRDEASVIGPRSGSGKWCAVPEAIHDNLSDDVLKTFVLELVRMVGNSQAKQVSGKVPTLAELDGYSGRELYDLGSNSTRKPRYVDEVEGWQQRMERTGAN